MSTPGSAAKHTVFSPSITQQLPSSQASPISHATQGQGQLPDPNDGSFHTPDSPSYQEEYPEDNMSVSFNLARINKNVLDFSASLAAMCIEVNENQKIQEYKLSLLEASLNTKHTELADKLDTKLTTYDTIIDSAADLAKSTATQLDDLKDMVQMQAATIQDLQELVTSNEKKSTEAIREVLAMANGIEAHQRRWSLRIIGMESPKNGNEATEQAKHAVLDFIKDKLQVDNVMFEDIDCTQRVGEVVDNKQSMLFRCFSRDLVQILLKNGFNVKGSQTVLYEDSTYLHRKLLQALKDDPRIDSAWLYNGSVWAKMAANARISEFTLLDDIQSKITTESAKKPGTTK